MRSALLLLTICLALFSCKKNELTPAKFLECHQSQNFDSTAVSNRLVGIWSLSSLFCTKTTTPTIPNLANEPLLKATFNSDGSFNLTSKGSIITQGNWKIKTLGSNMWGLDLTAPSEYLKGRILFCENLVLFNNTYINGQGCDVRFFK